MTRTGRTAPPPGTAADQLRRLYTDRFPDCLGAKRISSFLIFILAVWQTIKTGHIASYCNNDTRRRQRKKEEENTHSPSLFNIEFFCRQQIFIGKQQQKDFARARQGRDESLSFSRHMQFGIGMILPVDVTTTIRQYAAALSLVVYQFSMIILPTKLHTYTLTIKMGLQQVNRQINKG